MFYNQAKENLSCTCFGNIGAMSERFSGVLEYLHTNNDIVKRIYDDNFGFNMFLK